jgi:hypothetical protein
MTNVNDIQKVGLFHLSLVIFHFSFVIWTMVQWGDGWRLRKNDN